MSFFPPNSAPIDSAPIDNSHPAPLTSPQTGYYRFPTIQGDRIVFVCEDDLWSVAVTGGTATRLTANLGEVSHPHLSPDGRLLAYVGRDEGHAEVYVMPSEGGVARRLTFLGADVRVIGWSRDGASILFTSNAAQPFYRIYTIYQINPQGGLPEPLNVGLAHHLSEHPSGGKVLGRNTNDIARWKRYRGGTAGVLWIDPTGAGQYQRLELPGNVTTPMWIAEPESRIYFISDYEGVGNLYSCTPDGQDLRRQTNHVDYYVRNAKTDGRRIVYHAGGELFCVDPVQQTVNPIAIDFHSPQIQRQRKFVDAANYLGGYELHPEGHSSVVTCRGKSFAFGNWEGAVTQLGEMDGVRYRLARWLNDEERLIMLSDASGEEVLEIHSPDFQVPPVRLEGLDLGRAIALEVSPTEDQIIVSNHRNELIWVDLETQQSRVIDRSDHHRIYGFQWSPDGQWVAYSFAETAKVSVIKLCQVATGTIHRVTAPLFRDFAPAFDPEGKYLYFLSSREFNPVYDGQYFDLGFPRSDRPYLITLQKDLPSPFIPAPKSLVDKKSDKSEKSDNGKSKASKSDDEASEPSETNPPEASEEPTKKADDKAIAIDFEGIQHRVIAFPVSEGDYRHICGIKGKVLFTSFPIQGSLDEEFPGGSLLMYDFEKQKQETIAKEVWDFRLARQTETLIYRSKRRLRVCAIAPLNGKLEDEPNRKNGWLDLQRIRISVVPPAEWRQMYREAWRLQRDQFWVENMSGVDWNQVYDRYLPVLNKVTTRSEFSDLIWELQGELGTSHAYEMGGDYRRSPGYRLGFLGADFTYDAETDGYQITHIVRGDSWEESEDSPLHRLGVNIQVGDKLLAVNGQRVGRWRSPQELLVYQSNSEVALTVLSPRNDTGNDTENDTGNDTENGTEPRVVTVKAIGQEQSARYREWVERNRQQVHEQTGDRVGYVHVPNMGPVGYAEFHRYYAVEAQYDGLIVDVRYNGGGHVSQLLLEKLGRKRIGYDLSRWGQPESYPADAVAGAIVALTNEHAGSDGDIFSHVFKLMKLGTLIGKRTWGGVIGISPRHNLVDGSRLTQPEFSFWFVDVGWQVENYGTDPDIEVDIAPQDWATGHDPQLERAIAVILDQLRTQPVVMPDFGDRPNLALPSALSYYGSSYGGSNDG
jgi:tricorn protease